MVIVLNSLEKLINSFRLRQIKNWKDSELWKNNEVCPWCGDKANPDIFSCETGCDYCSIECARKHVKSLTLIGGW